MHLGTLKKAYSSFLKYIEFCATEKLGRGLPTVTREISGYCTMHSTMSCYYRWASTFLRKHSMPSLTRPLSGKLEPEVSDPSW